MSRDEKWSPDNLREFTQRIEFAKEQSGGSLESVLEIVEILELLEGMVADFPLPQQKYFREAVHELVGLAISYLENFRTDFGFAKGEKK